MENQQTLALWSSEEDIPPNAAPDPPSEPILSGQRVTTLDQRRATVIEVHGKTPTPATIRPNPRQSLTLRSS